MEMRITEVKDGEVRYENKWTKKFKEAHGEVEVLKRSDGAIVAVGYDIKVFEGGEYSRVEVILNNNGEAERGKENVLCTADGVEIIRDVNVAAYPNQMCSATDKEGKWTVCEYYPVEDKVHLHTVYIGEEVVENKDGTLTCGNGDDTILIDRNKPMSASATKGDFEIAAKLLDLHIPLSEVIFPGNSKETCAGL